ncbi:MAG: 50S ribosomal protein L13 [Candidatus Saccharimonadales bacterium]|jgi:large subunit ribosomal protein L13
MKSYSLKPKEITRKWYVLDASQASLGRVSTQAARLLLGKDKPSITAHMDGGDFVIIINASRLVVTGNKIDGKHYYRHSGFPGGLYRRTLDEQMKLDPTKVIRDSIRGMLPNNKLLDGRLKRLKVYAGSEHNHSAQTPETLSLNRKGEMK